MASELKACPFCGADDANAVRVMARSYRAGCRSCGAGVIGDTMLEAVDAWNCRAAPGEARAVYLTGETADAYRAWLEAERVRVQRIDEYNDRLRAVNAARRDGDWSLSIDPEYRRMTEAIGAANVAHERLRIAALPAAPKAEADHA